MSILSPNWKRLRNQISCFLAIVMVTGISWAQAPAAAEKDLRDFIHYSLVANADMAQAHAQARAQAQAQVRAQTQAQTEAGSKTGWSSATDAEGEMRKALASVAEGGCGWLSHQMRRAVPEGGCGCLRCERSVCIRPTTADRRLFMCICTHVAFLLLVGMLLQRWNR